jgi:tetratricopeptide (TPR) repeat protein
LDANLVTDAVTQADEAAALAQAAGLDGLRFDAMCVAAEALAVAGRMDEALFRLQAAHREQAVAADPQRLINYHGALGQVLYSLGQVPDAISAIETARELSRGQQQLTDLHVCNANLSVMHLTLGEAEVALVFARQACALSETLGLAKLAREIDGLNLGLAGVAGAQYGMAIDALTRYIDSGHTPRPWAEHARTVLGVVWTHVGQHARAQRLLPAIGETEGLPPFVLAARAFARLEARRARAVLGDADGVAAEAQAALDWARASGNHFLVVILRLRLTALRDPAGMASLAAELLADAERRSGRPQIVVAELALARALTGSGERAAALAHARAAAARLDGCSFVYLYKPELMQELAQCLLQLEDAETAKTPADRARRWIREQALPSLPESLRSTFLDRQSVNVQWLRTQPIAMTRNSSHDSG